MNTKSHNRSVIIESSGTFIPKRILTNEDLSRMVDTSDEWIRTRTGIESRHIANKQETPSYMGAMAAKDALNKANIDPQSIDLVIVATMTPDMLFPPTACLIQDMLGLRPIPSFDIEVACSGFVYALEVGQKMLACGAYKKALIIGTEKLSSILDWQDRRTCVLFGDGAGAVILSLEDNKPHCGIIDTLLNANGRHADILKMPAGGSQRPATLESISNKEHFLKMNGKEVFKLAVRLMEQSITQLLSKHNLRIEDVSCIIPHQANMRIIQSLAEQLGIPLNTFYCNLKNYGNTSAASIPIALNEALAKNIIRSGDIVLFTAIGGGLSWGSTLIRWH